jgi:hypothetical protein
VDDEQVQEPSRDVFSTRARWGSERGYIEVRNLATGETMEIPYGEATPVWKEDIRRLPRKPRRA